MKFVYINFIIELWLTAITTFLLGVFVLARNRHNIINKTFAFYSFSISWWSFTEIWGIACDNRLTALIWTRIEQVGVFFIPASLVHFIISLLDIKNKKWLVRAVYSLSVAFAILSFTPLMIADSIPKATIPYVKRFATAGIAYHFAIAFFFFCITYSLYELFKEYRVSKGARRNQLKYLLWPSLFGYIGGGANFLLVYDINIFPLTPFGTYFVVLYTFAVAYAIARYRLMDIRIAIARGAVFAFVYSVVLGAPLWIAYKLMGPGWWLVPTVIMAALASVGPFVFNYLRRQAEARLLAEERRAHQLLRSASEGMTRIRNLKKLLELIVHITSKILRVNNAAIFLLDNERKRYDLKAIRVRSRYNYLEVIDSNDVLIQKLVEKDEPIIYEEVKMQAHTDKGDSFLELQNQMKELRASLIAPSTAGDRLLGFLILGEKKSGRMYTQDDVALLTTLANQAALAIENALFYQQDAEQKALLYQSAILSDLGVMADSMGHQIKNHIQKMMADAGVQVAFVEEYLNKDLTIEQLKDALTKIKSTLTKIELQGKKGGELIESIRKFSHLPTQAFKEISLKETLDLANEILSFKVKFDEIDYITDIPQTLPLFYGHPVISEVWVNFIDNGNDATKDIEELLILEAKRQGKEPPLFRGRIEFIARQIDPNHIQIKISDNGIGIKKENLSHLFLPFYTTKATSSKGTGLGLYVIKNIINNHKGKIEIDSEYMKGTTFTITLPIRP